MPSNATTHGHASGNRVTTELRSYYHAKERCNNPKVKNWMDYGGRGIKFLFNNFEQFFAELGNKPKDMTLDRKDNNGNYEPGNVRWATRKQQRENQRKQCGSTSNTKGIHYKKETNKWVARLSVGGKRTHIGVYDTEKEAKEAILNDPTA